MITRKNNKIKLQTDVYILQYHILKRVCIILDNNVQEKKNHNFWWVFFKIYTTRDTQEYYNLRLHAKKLVLTHNFRQNIKRQLTSNPYT